MSDWTTGYPTTLDTTTEMPGITNGVTGSRSSHATALRDAVIAIEAGLGKTTSPAAGSVRKRLADLEAAAGGASPLLLADDTQRDEAGLTYVTHKSFRFAMDAASPWTAFRVAISLWHDTATSVEVRIAFDDPYGDAAVVTSTATAEDLQYVTIPWTGAVAKAFILGIVQLKRTGGTGNAHLKFLEIFGVK